MGLDEMAGLISSLSFKPSKWRSSSLAPGFPVMIVNPTAPIGDHDFKPTPTGKIVLDFLKGDLPAFVDTGLNVVDVGDTAEGHLLACERGKPGERYILGCENLTLEQILVRLALSAVERRRAGASRMRWPTWPAWFPPVGELDWP